MNNLSEHINNYLDWCKKQKRLDSKTLKSYRIDLHQFLTTIPSQDVAKISPRMVEYIIENMHQKYKPKTIPLPIIESILSAVYSQRNSLPTLYQRKNALRDAAVIELLFATGIRISELCSLKMQDVNLYDRTILIYGKGSKERKIQIGNDDVYNILQDYKNNFSTEINNCNYFFVNQNGSPLS